KTTVKFSQVNEVESRSVNDEVRLLEWQIKLREAEAIAKEADSEKLRLRIQLCQTIDGLTPRSSFSHFDPARAARLMPTFSEETVDEFFIAFERLATTLKWPIEFWPICSAGVCRLMPFVPGAYRQGFRGLRKKAEQTPPLNLSSKREVFSKWLHSKEVQRTSNPSLHRARQGNTNNSNFVHDRRSWTRLPPNGASKFSTNPVESQVIRQSFAEQGCSWNTGKPAMIITEETNTSPVGVMAGLSKADSMPIGLISTKGEFCEWPRRWYLSSLLSQGTVEVDGVETPVTILRDSGCLQTHQRGLRARAACCWSGSHTGNDLAGGQMGNVTPPPVLRKSRVYRSELQQLLKIICPKDVLLTRQLLPQDISSAVNAVTESCFNSCARARRFITALVSDSANNCAIPTRCFSQDGVLLAPLAPTD
ncbi:hypothetical protein Hamer_G008762, partial [Homarus americanus]